MQNRHGNRVSKLRAYEAGRRLSKEAHLGLTARAHGVSLGARPLLTQVHHAFHLVVRAEAPPALRWKVECWSLQYISMASNLLHLHLLHCTSLSSPLLSTCKTGVATCGTPRPCREPLGGKALMRSTSHDALLECLHQLHCSALRMNGMTLQRLEGEWSEGKQHMADLVAALCFAAAVGDVNHAGALVLAAVLRGLSRQVEGRALVAALVRAAPRVHALHVLQLVLPAVRTLPMQHISLGQSTPVSCIDDMR